VFGPATQITAGRSLNVRKADGSMKPVTIKSVSKSFQIDGVPCVYGYLAQTSTTAAAKPATKHSHFCSECGEKATKGTRCWETGRAH
jgi:hypothetical protein